MRILFFFLSLLKSHLTIPGTFSPEDPTEPRDDRSGG
jgi:hypothetical protein